MTTSTVSTLEQTIHKTNAWIGELRDELSTDSQGAYNALRAVLHALRDRLTVEEASDLGAQLPVLVRGIYYESFDPAQQPSDEADKQAFLDRVSRELNEARGVDPESAATAVFRLLAVHCTSGQVDHARGQLPKEVQALWPS